MFIIELNKYSYRYDDSRKTIIISEKGIPFGTSYVVKNPKTNGSKTFNLSHSTGSEFDVKTKWVYKSEDGISLEVCNDAEMTKIAAHNYLEAKLKK